MHIKPYKLGIRGYSISDATDEPIELNLRLVLKRKFHNKDEAIEFYKYLANILFNDVLIIDANQFPESYHG